MKHHVRSSPYLVLGVEFGASPAAANRAFARRLRELDALPLTQEDLNWAQSQFRRPEDLRTSVEFLRVPSGSAVRELPDVGLFRPGPTVDGSANVDGGANADGTGPDRSGLERARAALVRSVITQAIYRTSVRTTHDPYESDK